VYGVAVRGLDPDAPTLGWDYIPKNKVAAFSGNPKSREDKIRTSGLRNFDPDAPTLGWDYIPKNKEAAFLGNP